MGLKHISSDFQYIESENINNPYFNIRTSEELVWLGSVKGLECYNPKTGIFTTFSLPGITKYIVYSLINDGEGNIWTGTNQGLAHFNTKTNTTELFQEKDGLSCNVVYALAKDVHGNIWCSTRSRPCRDETQRRHKRILSVSSLYRYQNLYFCSYFVEIALIQGFSAELPYGYNFFT